MKSPATIDEAAEFLGVSREFVHEALERGELARDSQGSVPYPQLEAYKTRLRGDRTRALERLADIDRELGLDVALGPTPNLLSERLKLRRIGNSLGVVIPKEFLERWEVREGDSLEITETGIRPRLFQGHAALDELKRLLAVEVVKRFEPSLIRAKILANLHSWKERDTWCTAYDEWKAIAESGDDGRLFVAMLGRDDEANRLRQSAPYVGLLPKAVVQELNKQV